MEEPGKQFRTERQDPSNQGERPTENAPRGETNPNNPIALKVAQEQVEKISRETKKEPSKKMRGRSREERKGPADEKEQTGPEAQDS